MGMIAKCRIEAGDVVLLAGDPVDTLDKAEIKRLVGLGAVGDSFDSSAPLVEQVDGEDGVTQTVTKKAKKDE